MTRESSLLVRALLHSQGRGAQRSRTQRGHRIRHDGVSSGRSADGGQQRPDTAPRSTAERLTNLTSRTLALSSRARNRPQEGRCLLACLLGRLSLQPSRPVPRAPTRPLPLCALSKDGGASRAAHQARRAFKARDVCCSRLHPLAGRFGPRNARTRKAQRASRATSFWLSNSTEVQCATTPSMTWRMTSWPSSRRRSANQTRQVGSRSGRLGLPCRWRTGR